MWDKRFLALTELIATWSKDPSTQVGAVVVDADKRVVSLGYNGVPRGVEEVLDGNRNRKLLRTIHAEENALHFAHRDLGDCTIYVSTHPCAKCAAHIIQRGIKRVVCRQEDGAFYERWKESIAEAEAMFKEANVTLIKKPH
jgi:dCMP deaminase